MRALFTAAMACVFMVGLRPAVCQQADTTTQPLTLAVSQADPPDMTIARVDLGKADLQHILQILPKMTNREFRAEGELPDKQITLTASNVKLSTLLDLICQSAGVGWRVDHTNGKPVYVIGTSANQSGIAVLQSLPIVGRLFDTAPADRIVAKINGETVTSRVSPDQVRILTTKPSTGYNELLYTLTAGEQRSTFTCPYCKGSVKVIEQPHEPRCPKCGRTFQANWQFCPFDGAKRPAPTAPWHFCPLCGKEVRPEKAEPKAEGLRR